MSRTYTVRGQESVPVDATARRVVSKGETPPGWAHLWRQTAPAFDAGPHPELLGHMVGRAEVVGYAGRKCEGSAHRWYFRCQCGIGFVRSANPRTIRSAARRGLWWSCEHCQRKGDNRKQQRAQATWWTERL